MAAKEEHAKLLSGLSAAKAKAGGYAAASPPEAPSSGGLTELLTDVMAPSGEVPVEKSKEELAAMTKDERTAYHKSRQAAAKAQPKAKAEVSKSEARAKAREKQEADRKRKEDEKNDVGVNAEALAELKLQGLTDEQAAEVLKQMTQSKVAEEEEDSDDEDATLLGSVRKWMAEQASDRTNEESLRDFNLKVRFQGHVDTTPPDHLGAILQVLSAHAFKDLELAVIKQPGGVVKKVQPIISRWSYMLNALYKKCDVIEAADIVVSSLHRGVADAGSTEATADIVVVGFLMTIRDEEDMDAMSDEELLTGCRRRESESKVMKGFIGFLEDAIEDDDESGSDDA